MKPGDRLGPFRIVAYLGGGAMGEVYRAIDEPLDREVALKVLRPELAHRHELVDRFRIEARTLARLKHPKITPLHGLTTQDSTVCMVMEFVSGETLAHRLHRIGRLDWREAVDITSQVLEALAYAHAAQVVHRDVKPANIMICPDHTVMIMDFGISRVIGSSRQTEIGRVVGTFEYMSPEQVKGEEVTAQSDLYAVGIVLYEMATGRAPFAGTDYELMKQHLETPAPSIAPLAGDAPRWLDQVIARAVSKLPADRYRTAAEMRDDLRRQTSLEPEPALPPTRIGVPQPLPPTRVGDDLFPPGPPDSGLPVLAPPARSRFRIAALDARSRWIAGGAALIVVAATAYWMTSQDSNEIAHRASSTPAPAPATGATLSASPTDGRPAAPAPAPAPVRETPPAPPTPSFARLQYTAQLPSDDGKGTGREVTLRLDPTRIAVTELGGSRTLRQIPYTAVRSATYRPRSSFRVVYRATEHWLTVASNGADLVLRLDKNDYEEIIRELAKRTGVTVAKQN